MASKKKSVGIIGTHGKTTCTAMLGVLAAKNGIDPLVIVGSGVVDFGGAHSRVGSSEVIIAELCEYKNHFLNSKPDFVLLTNIEHEHVDFFETLEDVEEAYVSFLKNLADNAVVVYCVDSPSVLSVLDHDDVKSKDFALFSYGYSDECDYRVVDREVLEGKQRFGLENVGEFEIGLSGEHNVLNVCGVIALSHKLGISFEDSARYLKEFQGSVRRMELKGEIDGVKWFDDYGHHPTEIKTTLKGLREFYKDSEIWCVFQSHTYSRTKVFFEEFSDAFDDVDHVVITDIFASAREVVDESVSGASLALNIAKKHPDVIYMESFGVAADFLREKMKKGDILITMGAGVAYKVGQKLMESLVVR